MANQNKCNRLHFLGRFYCSELETKERDLQRKTALVEIEYQQLVASRGEAEPLWGK